MEPQHTTPTNLTPTPPLQTQRASSSKSHDYAHPDDDPTTKLTFRFSFKKLFAFTGPAWLMSLAYLDPGNLESDLQQGAYTGMQLVWVLWWATVMGLVLQEMAARIAIVTGADLAQTVRARYPRALTYIVYVMMEIAVIGSDIQEVVGSAISINLLSGGRVAVWVGCLITGLDTFTFLAVHYLGKRYLEALIFTLILAMAVCFFINWGMSPSVGDTVARGWLLPTVERIAITQAVGTVGAVIMPHNLYLHAGLVLERDIDRKSRRQVFDAIWYSRIESAVALAFAFAINLAVVASNAANFFVEEPCAHIDEGPFACLPPEAFALSGDTGHAGQGGNCSLPTGGVGKCGALGLKAEGFALAGVLGDGALYIWALGLFAAGQASTMTCTYAGQVIMAGCVHLAMQAWQRVAITRAFALVPALIVSTATVSDENLFININEYLNVLQSVQLPFAMLPVLHFASSRALLGEWQTSGWTMLVTFSLAALVMGVNVYLIVDFLAGADVSAGGLVCVVAYGVFYFGVCVALVSSDARDVAARVCSCCSSHCRRYVRGTDSLELEREGGGGDPPKLLMGEGLRSDAPMSDASYLESPLSPTALAAVDGVTSDRRFSIH